MLEKQQRVREKRQVLQLLFEKKQGSLFQNVPVAFVDGYSCQTDTAYVVASKMSLKK